jgi:hypothetical protein
MIYIYKVKGDAYLLEILLIIMRQNEYKVYAIFYGLIHMQCLEII